MASADDEEPQVRVYWRPGCGFCMSLRRRLHQAGLPTEEINIWAEPEAAAFVRRHARGNETVPTVDVAGTVMVNPPPAQVLALAADAGIGCTPPPPRPTIAERVKGAFGGRDPEA